MTRTHRLLKLMSDGLPRTSAQIAAETGLTGNVASKALHGLARSGYLRKVEKAYTLTGEGQDKAATEPLSKAEVLCKAREFVRPYRFHGVRLQALEHRHEIAPVGGMQPCKQTVNGG